MGAKVYLEAEHISFSYEGQPVLEDLSFTLAEHSSTAVLGLSGTGKTTLLHILSGLKQADQGRVRIQGEDLCGPREKTALILQNYGLFPWKTVYENIAFPLRDRALSQDEIEEKLGGAIRRLGLNGLEKRYPHALSGGEKQRVALARALAMDAELLLMDEATAALDAYTKEQMQELILDTFRQSNLTLFFVTHSVEESIYLGQNILLLHGGQALRMLPNPLWGKPKLHNDAAFYQFGMELREAIYRGAH